MRRWSPTQTVLLSGCRRWVQKPALRCQGGRQGLSHGLVSPTVRPHDLGHALQRLSEPQSPPLRLEDKIQAPGLSVTIKRFRETVPYSRCSLTALSCPPCSFLQGLIYAFRHWLIYPTAVYGVPAVCLALFGVPRFRGHAVPNTKTHPC